MYKKNFLIFASTVVGWIFFLPLKVCLAGYQTLGPLESIGDESGFQTGATGDLRVIVANLINISLTFLGVIFLVLVLYGGFSWMTAGGEEDKIKKAIGTIRNGVIGLIIILSAFAISRFVFSALLRATT